MQRNLEITSVPENERGMNEGMSVRTFRLFIFISIRVLRKRILIIYQLGFQSNNQIHLPVYSQKTE